MFERLVLTVEPPNQIHNNWKISFDSSRKSFVLTGAYNGAIEKIATEARWNPFHQSGTHNHVHEPTYHMWEMWKKLDEATVTAKLEEIHKLAEERFKDLDKAGFEEFWHEQYDNR